MKDSVRYAWLREWVRSMIAEASTGEDIDSIADDCIGLITEIIALYGICKLYADSGGEKCYKTEVDITRHGVAWSSMHSEVPSTPPGHAPLFFFVS